jgi:antitoxin component YwqK of YwqJK toxin-antitoxin module
MKNITFLSFMLLFSWQINAQDTVKTFYSGNRLMSIGVKNNDKEQGEWIFYHTNGAKWTQGSYQDGVKVGLWKTWNDSGQLVQEYFADNGYFKSWFANGQAESVGEMKNSTKNGAWTFYHSNGQLMKKVEFENDELNGHVIEYYPNGQKKFEGDYTKGLFSR